VTFGALGDIHGDFEAVRAIMTRHPEVPFWLCVGDVAANDGHYESPPAPLYWIKGNNEDFDFVRDQLQGRRLLANLHYLPNGVVREVGPLRIAGLGGTFAPTWYDKRAADLPGARRMPRPGGPARKLGAARDDKRRHFVRAEVEACKALRHIDVFLTHEAARPFVVTDEDDRRGRHGPRDAGKTPINEVLAAMRPRLHLFGHHHQFVARVAQGVTSICLDMVSQSYLLVDAESWHYEKRDR